MAAETCKTFQIMNGQTFVRSFINLVLEKRTLRSFVILLTKLSTIGTINGIQRYQFCFACWRLVSLAASFHSECPKNKET